jgi:Fe-S-cluster containining protein
MPHGKPAGKACIHLTEDYRCNIYDHPDRPKVCADFHFDPEVCGTSREEAMMLLSVLEREAGSGGSP